MASIAIIGTGIAGLGCGYFLHQRHDINFFEQNDYVGGHTNTVTVDEDGTPIPIDTGFMVYNEVTYPNLTRLFRELDVPTMETSMSFSVQHVPSGLEFCGSGLSGVFGQRKNFFNLRFYRLLLNITRFNKEAIEILDDPSYVDFTLDQYVSEKKYSRDFFHRYLIPMSSAVWSTPPEKMLDFPAVTLVRFFQNHGLLGFGTHHQWRTVSGGSKVYRDLMIKPFKTRIHLRMPVRQVFRQGQKVVVETSDGSQSTFDRIIFASHADQTLRMLAEATDRERNLLKEFKYQTNIATLHTDARVMPGKRRIWSSWNYRIERDGSGVERPSTVYYMNSLQKVSQKKDYFVSIDDPGTVSPDQILKTITYEHPLYTPQSAAAQKDLPSLNETGPFYFCGSYFRYGFHEDAFTSAIRLCEKITGGTIW
jgi:predicted NAD/FAD-binding protein